MEGHQSAVSISSFSSAENNYTSKQQASANLSRRSVDWRDSGIVIDEEQPQSNSIDSIYNSFSLSSTSSCSTSNVFHERQQLQVQKTQSATSTTNSCCPIQGLAFGPDDADGDTILHLAVVGFSLGKVRDLINLCDLNAINNMMQTPLHVAVLANRPEMVQLMIDSGASIDVYDRKGNTPLHLACQKGLEEIVKLILNCGTKQNKLLQQKWIGLTNFDGQTSLHLAAMHDRRKIIGILVNEYDANLNCQDNKSGETIMHKAISQFNTGLVKFILSLPNHCNLADYSGRRPLDTIRILRESRIDQIQMQKLMDIDRFVHERIEFCIKTSSNCCRLEHMKCNNAILDSSESSSSDYSDSDYDLN